MSVFTILEHRSSYKDLRLTYVCANRRLVVDLEMSGVPGIAWVGLDSAFDAWTEPPGLALDDGERRTVRDRIEAWGLERWRPIDFGPGVSIAGDS